MLVLGACFLKMVFQKGQEVRNVCQKEENMAYYCKYEEDSLNGIEKEMHKCNGCVHVTSRRSNKPIV